MLIGLPFPPVKQRTIAVILKRLICLLSFLLAWSTTTATTSPSSTSLTCLLLPVFSLVVSLKNPSQNRHPSLFESQFMTLISIFFNSNYLFYLNIFWSLNWNIFFGFVTVDRGVASSFIFSLVILAGALITRLNFFVNNKNTTVEEHHLLGSFVFLSDRISFQIEVL